MNKKIVFISDIHLSPNTVNRNQVFANLMSFWENSIDELYILGDFFDYWCGDEDSNEFILQIKNILKCFTQKKNIYMMRGNHDFMIGKLFAKETGVKLINDCHILELNNNKILLTHGDKFCTLDKNHQRLRFYFYNNNILKFFLNKLSLKTKYRIKELLIKESKNNYNSKPKDIYMLVNKDIAKFALKRNCNMIINGHTHTPGTYDLNYKNASLTRIEIADWVDRKPGGHILFENDKFTLVY